jgi:two-component system heavy metal sensor histidine kinase CusS
MNTTLRTRLVLSISAAIVITLAATQYGMYVMMRRQLYTEFDQHLGAKARALAVLVEQQGDRIEIEFQRHPMQEYARAIRPEYYQVWHEDGSVLSRSRRLKGDLTRLDGDRVIPLVAEFELPDKRPGRAAGIRFRPNLDGELPVTPNTPVRGADGRMPESGVDDDDADTLDLDTIDYAARPYVTLVIARDTQDLDASLANLAWLLIGSGLFATAIIVALLAWLVKTNLRPLQALTHQIAKVNEQTLNQRFALTNAPGELQPVVARLNVLMNCLETAFLREKTFTADVAHELRTPLAGIRSTLEVGLSRQRDSASYRTSMERCLRISEETETIISTLLSLSRIEAGQTTLEQDVVDVASTLRHTWSRFEVRAAGIGVNVEWRCELPILVETDPGKLGVVLSNLLDNATSYVDPNGQILIQSQFRNGQLQITVENSGCELSPQQVDHVFDRFWRADTSRSATGSHSGLGLALTRRIVQFLGGTIEAAAVNGRFVITLKLQATRIDLSQEDEESEPHTAPESHTERGVILGIADSARISS